MANPAISSRVNRWAWLRQWFATPFSALMSVLVLGGLLVVVPPVLEWLLFGARWEFIADKYRLILFGLYPYDQQWRPLIACVLLIGVVLLSAARRFWKPWLLWVWVLVLAAVALLMWGGVLGMPFIENRLWGGLPLTLILATFGIALAFPLGVVLALGRRSQMPVVKALCVIYIELIRGVPLISLLFMASVMFPLFLPAGWEVDKLLRAQLAIVMFVAAYIAETVRGGLQGVPKGQYASASALGLGYWQQMRFVVLPQALSAVIGPLTGIFISLFKDTSLVVVIGLFDLTQAAKAAVADAQWQSYSLEAYVFIAAIYFIFCFGMSRYSRRLEGRLSYAH